jgi:cobalt-zinc-cadmium efflux system membrane fusion protein
MFVTAIFRGKTDEPHVVVPAAAILHLHDQDWVYLPLDGKKFRRVKVIAGEMLPGGMQEIVTGANAGQKLVANALEFQNAVEQ